MQKMLEQRDEKSLGPQGCPSLTTELRALMLLHLRTSHYVEITNVCIVQQRGLMLSRTFSQKHLNGLRYETLW